MAVVDVVAVVAAGGGVVVAEVVVVVSVGRAVAVVVVVVVVAVVVGATGSGLTTGAVFGAPSLGCDPLCRITITLGLTCVDLVTPQCGLGL